jgi:hypothetical protein
MNILPLPFEYLLTDKNEILPVLKAMTSPLSTELLATTWHRCRSSHEPARGAWLVYKPPQRV